MNEQQPQQRRAPAMTGAGQVPSPAKSESDFQRLLNQPHKGTCEYIPYGAQDRIKITVPIIQNLIAVKTKSGRTCSERDAIKFLAMCQAKRMNPFEGDCFLIGYDNNQDINNPTFALVTAHQTYLKRAELHPEFDGMKSGVIVADENGTLSELEGDFFVEGQTVVGGWATVFFKNRKVPMCKRLRLGRFAKGFGVWRDDPAGMICKCAEADALRSSFPTMLGGLYLREELRAEVDPEEKLTRPKFEAKGPALFTPAAHSELPEGHPEPVIPNGHAEPEPELERRREPEPEPERQPQQRTPGFQPLKALTNLINMVGISPAQLLDYLSVTGATDGSVSSLEELPVETAKSLCDNWPVISAQIKAQVAKLNT